jgi:hypothetical protein
MSVIPAVRGLRQEDHEFEGSLSYIMRSCLKNKIKTTEQKKGPGAATHTCNPGYKGGRGRKILVPG